MIEKIGNRLFRYNADKCIVEYVDKATPDMYADDEEWIAKYGKPLWGIDKDGYIVLDSAGLSKEHWDNKEDRIMYLTEWNAEISCEVDYLANDFIANEWEVWKKDAVPCG